MRNTKVSVMAILSLSCAIGLAQDSYLAPRSALLTGTADYPSAKGTYYITFPAPNDCVELGPIKADSRSHALYIATSEGGFVLKPAKGGLTVWTAEEWDHSVKMLGKKWLDDRARTCAERSK